MKSKRAVKQRFYRAMTGLQQRLGWSAKQIASHYGLPHRSVLNWLTGKVCPGSQRLRELCETGAIISVGQVFANSFQYRSQSLLARVVLS